MTLMKLASTFLARPVLFIIAGVAAAIAVACVVAFALYEMRVDALARARDTADNLALILQRDIERNLEIYELSMEAVIDGVKDPDVLRLPPKIQQLVLFDRSSNAKDMGSLLVTDAAGDIIIDSRSVPPRKNNLADRDYFQIHRQTAPYMGVYISKPFSPRAAGADLSIGLSQRLDDAQGQFTGIVVGTLRLNYFRRLFDGLTLGTHDSITLLKTDGTVLMRRPYHEEEIGRSIASAASFKPLLQAEEGSYLGTAALDGAQRLYSFKHIGKYQLVVVVGLATDDIYAEWKRRAWAIGGVMGLLDALFVMVAVALAKQFQKRLEVEQQLQLLADTDSLTGLGTRRALDTSLDVEWRRAKRNKHSLAVLMVDADNFKAFNDHYGHVAGDAALIVLARCIAENIRRPGDFAGRYGGEEFCVLLPNTDLAGGVRVAEKIRQAVAAANRLHVGSPSGQLTVSIGVAAFDGDAASGLTEEQLVHQADQQLYEAKAAGRNLVMPQELRSQAGVA
ncbi:diguanylate cyclase [Ralstonia solanacearum]|nr:diguanylate cyclase [Ralstonia solanacearum]